MLDAGIPMPAVSAPIPMPSYAGYKNCFKNIEIKVQVRKIKKMKTFSTHPPIVKEIV
jgi:hypothetical protein